MFFYIKNDLLKSGPYIGPKGGKWADPDHTIPWDEKDKAKKPKAEKETKKQVKGSPGSQLPSEIQARLKELGVTKLPQANIEVANIQTKTEGDDIHDRAVIVWRDNAGRIQSGYTPEFHAKNAEQKWKRVKAFSKATGKIKTAIRKQLKNSTPGSTDHQAALIAGIISETGLRPGSVKSKEAHGHYGVSTLAPEHIEFKGGKAYFEFIGKSGKNNTSVLADKELVSALKYYADKTSEGESLFDRSAKKRARGVLPKGMKLKDFRTLLASDTADKFLHALKKPPPLTGDEKKDKMLLAKGLLEASKEVAQLINNTPAVARASYVHPEVFKSWAIKHVGASPRILR